MSAISKLQLKAVQALWSVHCQRTLGTDPNDRPARLKWLTAATGRPISSTLDLSAAEARMVIDTLKGSLGQRSEGRRGNDDTLSMLVDERSLKVIEEYRERLTWTKGELDAWLAGKHSPIGGRAVIRTVGDARRVQYGMRGLLKAKGLWRKAAPPLRRQSV
ncbi:MAG: hypothetical protein WCC59_15080 [Terriglobales bacterium]